MTSEKHRAAQCGESANNQSPDDRKRNVVEIECPEREDSGGPRPHPLDAYCNIAACGDVDRNQVREILSVRGRIDSGPWVQGDHDYPDWSFEAVGPAVSGAVNTLNVEVTYIPLLSEIEETYPAHREFCGTGGGPSCYSGGSAAEIPVSQRTPVCQLMPRYYKLTVNVQALNPKGVPSELLLGGLLQVNSVYLAYDVAVSTPAEPVWRDINLPESAGRWTLRLTRCCGRLAGELVLQQLGEKDVYPPVVFCSDSWDIRGLNILGTAFAEGQTQDRLALGVVAEPA